MILFSKNGLQLSYPEAFKLEDDLKGPTPSIVLKDRKTKGRLYIIVYCVEATFEHTYEVSFDPKGARYSNRPDEIIRAGDYPGFPGAKEILLRDIWAILVPVGGRVVTISVSIENDEAEINNIWKPIVESIKFDPARIGLQSNEPDITSHNWAGMSISKKYKHFQHTFQPENAMVFFYDSRVDFTPEIYFDTDAFSKKIIKSNQQAVLCPSDALEIVIDFYLSANLPNESEPIWTHVIEGIIAVDSGKLYVTPDIVPEVAIIMKKGNYNFRIYFGHIDAENDAENLSIYFWPTKEKETNKVTIIKEGPF